MCSKLQILPSSDCSSQFFNKPLVTDPDNGRCGRAGSLCKKPRLGAVSYWVEELFFFLRRASIVPPHPLGDNSRFGASLKPPTPPETGHLRIHPPEVDPNKKR